MANATQPQQKTASARAFVRSINILLKFVRMYGFDHLRSAEQFQVAWKELRAAIPPGDETGLLLGASGPRLLLDGIPLEAAPAERSFAQLLSAAGLASLHFLPSVRQEDLARLVRAFPAGNTKPSSLAEELKTALATCQGIRINEIRFVAEDSSHSEVHLAASLTAKALGLEGDRLKDWLNDPQKLLQLIAAAEGSRKGPGTGTGAGGSGPAAGSGIGPGSGLGTASGAGAANPLSALAGDSPARDSSAEASSIGPMAPRDEEIFGILRMLTRVGQSAAGEGSGLGPGPLQQELSSVSDQSRNLLQRALATLAAQSPAVKSNDPMLVRLAEHLAIRFALDRYERGEVRVNSVRQMIERMSQEIGALRKILGTHEETMAQAGIAVESHADLLDRQFWAAVPDAGKRTVLASSDAWCIPPRNVRQYVEELLARPDLPAAQGILENYASAIAYPDTTARRRTSIGLAELADLYAAVGAPALMSALRAVGLQLSLERDPELQGLVSAAFVRLAQEAGARKFYRAVLQALDSLAAVENQRPTFAQSIRPRLGLEKRLPEFMDEAIRVAPEYPDGMIALLERLPRPAAEYLLTRFNRAVSRDECEHMAHLAGALGSEAAACLRESLQHRPPAEAAEATGLLSLFDAHFIERVLGNRLRDWPRMPQDRALRLLASSGAPERGWLLLSLFDQFDPLLQPLAVDEIGMSGDATADDRLVRLASGELPAGTGDFLRLKAVEGLGRVCARQRAAADLLREIAEAKKMWRWTYHHELRIAAYLALCEIDPAWAEQFLPHSGLTSADLDLQPRPAAPNSKFFRQRRYPRIRLTTVIPATAASDRETIALEIRALTLSGGLASGAKHITPGTLVSLRLGSGLRPIRAQAFMRGARAQALSFEFADMELDERARLRRILFENRAGRVAAPSDPQ